MRCNGCAEYRGCNLKHYTYNAHTSHAKAKDKARSSRTGFDLSTSGDSVILMSYINSVPRPVLEGTAPIDLVIPIVGKEALDVSGIEKINPDGIVLKPSLLKDEPDNE